MARPTKFIRGEVIRDPGEAFALLRAGRWFYHNRKVQHPGWLLSWRSINLIHACQAGTLTLAEPNPDYVPPECDRCEGGGWECYGLGYNDPHFRVCQKCGNPKGLPCP